MNSVMELKLKEITLSKLNPRKRFDDKKMEELVASIKEKGVIVPIIVRKVKDGYQIVCGERRYRACLTARKESIPAIVRDLTDNQVLEFQAIENLQREDIHPLEEAEGYELLLKKHGYKTVDDIAAKIGKSKAYIYRRMKLCELIPDNRKLFYDGKLSPSVALLVARVPAHLQKEAGKAVAENDDYGDDRPMTYQEAREYIEENLMLQMKEAQFDTKEKGLAGKGSCAECPKRTGNQKELFADVAGADRCTDPACFEAKKNAFMQRKVADLKKQGKTVLPPEEAKKIFRYEHSTTPDYKYVTLDEHDWRWPTNVTARKMLKAAKDVKVVHAVHPFSGKLIEMVDRTDLPKLFKASGIKTDSPVNNVEGIAKHKKEERIHAAKRTLWIDKVSKNITEHAWNTICLAMLLEELQYMGEDEILDNAPSGFVDLDDIYKLSDQEIKKIIDRIIHVKPESIEDRELELLFTKLGFSVAKDYVITKEYLEACTKEDLVKLIKELGIKTKDPALEFGPEQKKSTLVEFILKHAPKGKVPKELLKK